MTERARVHQVSRIDRASADSATGLFDRETVELLEDLPDSVSVFTAIRDESGKVVDFRWEFANRAQAAIIGAAAERFVGRTLLEVLPEHGPSGLLDSYRNVVESGQPWFDPTVWYEDVWADGQQKRRAFDVRAAKHGDGFIVVARDVTEQREREEATNQAKEAATRASMGSAALQECVRVEEALEVIARAAPFVFEGIAGAIYRPASSENAFILVSSWGDYADGELINVEDCWALRSRAVRIFGEDPLSLRCAHAPESVEWTACIPIVAQGQILALIHIQHSERPRAWVTEVAAFLSTHWGFRVANVRLQESLRELSVRDPLTGLFNRRFLDEALASEWHRTNRNESALCLVMLDIDHFKPFNDTYGHQAGDTVLRDLGKFLLGSTRGGDIVGRFGGEEFMIIMPNMTEDDAAPRVGSLLDEWRERSAQNTGGPPSPTISAGLAMHVRDQSSSYLLGTADRALYAAKAAGRDRLVVGSAAV
jgi:diguanylate cyclase (GGDEF)-like protein